MCFNTQTFKNWVKKKRLKKKMKKKKCEKKEKKRKKKKKDKKKKKMYIELEGCFGMQGIFCVGKCNDEMK